eukprot:scaffold76056_cov70-Phaeocystis_antarctica.AAC.2
MSKLKASWSLGAGALDRVEVLSSSLDGAEGRLTSGRGLAFLGHVCQSKVGKACHTVGIEKDVGGLHVTVQELVGV